MIREEDPRFKNLEQKIGIFIVLALAGIAISFVLFGLQKDYFTKKYELHFTADRGTGFSKGMAVKLSGFRIGRVTSITLNDQANVDITAEIDHKYRTWIRSDSMVKLLKEGLIGENVVEISVGSSNKPELKNNEKITYMKTKALDEMADEIAEKVKPVLIEVRDIISYINNPDGDLKKSIRNLEVLTRNLDGTRQKADNLLISANGNIERITNRTNRLLESAGSKIEPLDLGPVIGRVNNTIDNIDRRVPPILDSTNAALVNVKKISEDTRMMTEQAFPKIPGILSQAEDVLFSSDKLLNSIRRSWLVGDTSAPTGTPGFIRGDSYE